MKDNLLNGIVLADLHFGAINSNRFMEELDGCLFKYLSKFVLKEHQLMDFIVIAGDTFDLSEPFNSTVVQNVIRFMAKLACYTGNLWVIEGTRSHDALQTETLKTIFNGFMPSNSLCTARFIDKMTKIEYDGAKILFLPEEFVPNPEIYYDDWLSEKYDLIFGHGMIDDIWYANGANNKQKQAGSLVTPVFSVDKLCAAGNYVYFGHVHEHKSYGPNGRFKYVGPTTRWEFGKEWDCGYYHITYDKTSKIAVEKFIPNTFAQKLDTVSMSINDDMTLEQIQDRISTLAIPRADDCDKLRVIVNIPRSLKDFDVIRALVITKLSSCSKITPVIKVIEDVDGEDSKEEPSSLPDQTMFVNSTEDVRIKDFIKSTMDKDVSITSIRDTIGYSKVCKQEDSDE